MSIYYVKASGGSDLNSGLSFSDAWATIAHAEAAAVANDEIRICADGVHTPSATVVVNGPSMSLDEKIRFIGANSIGEIDGTKAVIDGTLTGSNGCLQIADDDGYVFENLHIVNAAHSGINVSSSATEARLAIVGCEINDCNGHGVLISATGDYKNVKIVNCEIHNNGDNGVSGQLTHVSILHSKIYENDAYGVSSSTVDSMMEIIGNAIYSNGSSGVTIASNSRGMVIVNNVFYNNSGHGLYLNTVQSTVNVVYNNIFRSNSGYAIFCVSTGINQFYSLDFNCFSGNITGIININGGVIPGINNLYDDPLFTSELAGSENFNLQDSSPCKDTGIGY